MSNRACIPVEKKTLPEFLRRTCRAALWPSNCIDELPRERRRTFLDNAYAVLNAVKNYDWDSNAVPFWNKYRTIVFACANSETADVELNVFFYKGSRLARRISFVTRDRKLKPLVWTNPACIASFALEK